MTTSTSRLAFSDCFEALDRALEDEYGIRIRLNTENEAINLRMRMHTARTIDRKDNMAIHEETPDHPLYGRSIYDVIAVRIRQNAEAVWLYLEKIKLRGEVEALSVVGDWVPPAQLPKPVQAQVTYAPPLQIEHFKRRV